MSNPKVAQRNAKLHRMLRAGKLQPPTKAEMRIELDNAVAASVRPIATELEHVSR